MSEPISCSCDLVTSGNIIPDPHCPFHGGSVRTFRVLGGGSRTWTPAAYDGALALIRTLDGIQQEDRMDALALAVMAGLPLTRSPGVQFMLDDIARNEASRHMPSYVPPPSDPELYDWPKGQPKPLASPPDGPRTPPE